MANRARSAPAAARQSSWYGSTRQGTDGRGVRASAVDACQHGFIPLVVREAVGDRHPAPHETNLFDLQAKYAEVVSLGQVQTYLAGISGRTAGAPPTQPR